MKNLFPTRKLFLPALLLLSTLTFWGQRDPSEPPKMRGSFAAASDLAGGRLDTTFDGDGVALTDFTAQNDSGNRIAIQSDGKYVVAGTAVVLPPSTASIPAIVRYNADGTLDTTFDGDGKVTINASGVVRGLAIQPDGKIVIGGFIIVSSTVNDRFVARFNANGSVDTTFGTNGIFRVPIGKPPLDRGDIGLQADGKIVTVGSERLAGSTNDVFSVMRLNTDGTLDTTFDVDGRVTTTFVAADRGFEVEILPGGKILAVGYANGGSLFALARYNTDGSLDTTFDGDGKVTTSITPTAQSFNSTVQPDGKYLVGGSTVAAPSNSVIARYNTDGSVDTTFGTNGTFILDFNNGSADSMNTISVQPDGKIIGAGFVSLLASESGIGIIRLNPNGTLDPTFGTGGKVYTKFSPTFDVPLGTLIHPDGKLVIAGYGTFTATLRDFAVLRYNLVGKPNLFDFDGDGRDDISVFRDGTWWINQSTQGNSVAQFGLASDSPTPGDFDGDGKTDIAVWRSGDLGYFYIYNSSNNSVRIEQFGKTGDIPTVGDWNGDGRADPSVYRDSAVGTQSYFYYRGTPGTTANDLYIPYGIAGDRPVIGDYDGDSRIDLTVFRPANNVWYIRQSSDGQARYENWGLASDKFVPADYDGDSRTDLALFRNGTWYIRQSSNGQARYENWGLASDKLVPADYDGDGKTDIAVYRNGVWYVLNSTAGATITQYGLAGDQPVPASRFP